VTGCMQSLQRQLVQKASRSGSLTTSRTLAAGAHAERVLYTPETLPLQTGRPRLVVLGTGWAAARLCRDIDPKLYDITVSRYGWWYSSAVRQSLVDLKCRSDE